MSIWVKHAFALLSTESLQMQAHDGNDYLLFVTGPAQSEHRYH